jgi:hypothetical protein
MMLEHLGEVDAANAIVAAIETALREPASRDVVPERDGPEALRLRSISSSHCRESPQHRVGRLAGRGT